jgi:hypothetical protein
VATPERVGRLVQQAEHLLHRRGGRGINLHDPQVVAARQRSLVVRCAVTGWDGVASVVLKHYTGDDARSFTDWASLAFLSSLEEASAVAPHFYAGDAQRRFVVMEDLGGAHSLADLLEQPDAAAVVAALAALATSMARLVAATAGREETFVRLRATLPGGAGPDRQQEAARWRETRARIGRWTDALALPLPRGVDAACAHIAALYADPGPALAFSHGDPAPTNNHLGPQQVRLVDFEYAGYRHVLYDLTGWAILCPLPWAWVATMEQVFRRVLGASAAGRVLTDDGRYREAWATLCAYRALAMLTWLSPDLLVEDRAWAPGWMGRAAMLSTTRRLQQTSAGVAALAPLTDLGARMSEALRARWPTVGEGAPPWPAAASVPLL